MPGGFVTTSSGPGAISEASAQHGTNGSPITGVTANDAYDGYGTIGLRQGGGIVLNYGGLTVNRAVDVTHGPNDQTTPITSNFVAAGIPNAARWVETISNNTNAPITGTLSYFTNLGSDSNTEFVASSSGNLTSTTGNLFLVSRQAGGGSDPVVTHVLGNNAFTLNTAVMLHANGDDNPEWQYPVTIAPGETRTLILFNVLTADVNYDPANSASDIALGVQIANLITNNGKAIEADTVAFSLFSDLTRSQLQSAINYDFAGLTLDQSRPFFIETDYAVTHGPAEFDGGTLRPTGATTFALPFTVNAAGGTIDNTNGTQTFAGTISGVGGLTFAGGNTTVLSGVHTYGGATTVGAGTLVVNGSIANSSILTVADGGNLVVNGSIANSSILTVAAGGNLVVNGSIAGSSSLTVADGGRLGGSGTVGSVTVLSGGTIAPGNSIGTLTVTGNYTQKAGSLYEAEIDAAGRSDLIDVTGKATIEGGTVFAAKAPGGYLVDTRYTIVTADGGVSGTYDALTQNAPFVNLALSYGANAIYLDVVRNAVAFCDVTQTANQCASAKGVESLGTGTALYDAVAGIPDAASARAAFDSLSGEIHASTKTALIEDSRFLRDAAAARIRSAFAGVASPKQPVMAYADGGRELAPATTDRFAAWGQAFGSWGQFDGNGNSADLTRSIGGLFVGADASLGDTWRLGLLTGYSHSSFDVEERFSSGSSDNYHLGVYGGGQWGALGLRGGAAYSWHRVETERSVVFPGFADRLSGKYDAGTAQAFGEAGYRFEMASASFEPFANLAYVSLRTDDFGESGGAAALTGAGASTDSTFTTLGLRAQGDLTLGGISATARGMIGWRHAFGDTTPVAALAFSGGDAFTVAGTPIAKDAAVIEAGLDVNLSSKATLGLSYNGQIASQASDHGFQAAFKMAF